jgi:capsular polysaccharide biosynthesis protein
MKGWIKQNIIKLINSFNISSEKWGTPKGIVNAEEYCRKNNTSFKIIYAAKNVKQSEPITLNNSVHKIFKDEYERTQNQSFVATIFGGRVWGRNGAVISDDDLLLNDVSREFGAYGGVFGDKHSVFKQFKLAKPTCINGTVAVIASPGANNFHHWLYDNIARLHLIEEAGLLHTIDYFVLDYESRPFQNEVLQKLRIPVEKILNCHDNWSFHIKAKTLIIPSLPSRLGVLSDWTVDYLRKLLLPPIQQTKLSKRIYISRKKAPTRKVVNETELFSYLQDQGFVEYFAEDYSLENTAILFSESEFIVGVHGSGLSNLAFASKGVKVIDIIAPNHVDPYYWILTGFQNGKYAYFSGEGNTINEHKDLVKEKVDEDILVDMNSFKVLFENMNNLS